jgi:hypothetical protein
LDPVINRLLASEEKMLLTANSDMTEDGKFDERWLVVTNQRILTFFPNEDGRNPLMELPLREIKEAKAEALVGGGYVEISTDKKSISILHFSNSLADKFSEIVRGIQQLSKGENSDYQQTVPKSVVTNARDGCRKKTASAPRVLNEAPYFYALCLFLNLIGNL